VSVTFRPYNAGARKRKTPIAVLSFGVGSMVSG
jgi:hypothetical protein